MSVFVLVFDFAFLLICATAGCVMGIFLNSFLDSLFDGEVAALIGFFIGVLVAWPRFSKSRKKFLVQNSQDVGKGTDELGAKTKDKEPEGTNLSGSMENELMKQALEFHSQKGEPKKTGPTERDH